MEIIYGISNILTLFATVATRYFRFRLSGTSAANVVSPLSCLSLTPLIIRVILTIDTVVAWKLGFCFSDNCMLLSLTIKHHVGDAVV